MTLNLTALEIAERTKDGRLFCVQVVTDCLNRIEETDGAIGAWAFLDPDLALAQAEELDRKRQNGKPLGPLHGVPVGLKDIIDTADMPTECGSPIHAGRRPPADAGVVNKIREAGAIVLGKTVTTEFAFMHPSNTRNPHNAAHTPGGSSSGSAAAVAAGHVPLALGTQTNGSVIRPASFCGVIGFKPSRGIISRAGVLQTSATLDQMGIFARNLNDAAAFADALGGYDRLDPATYARPKPAMLAGARTTPPVEPLLAWFDLPFNDRLSTTARAAFDELLDVLGPRVERVPTPAGFGDLIDHHRVIHEYEIWRNLEDRAEQHWDQLSDTIKPILTRARAIPDDRYAQARAMANGADNFFIQFFNDFDAILAPSSTGEAPEISAGTGDPIFCTLWTLSGLPALSLPVLAAENDLPIGVQLIGSHEEDDRLFRTAAWFLQTLDGPGEEISTPGNGAENA
ncbi:Amidase [hydrothermal vent metagenome]|uniref:Amidase n=1 Tax=hydrothermal vent metagenome TaxID=652676 RepID=A0A3B0TKP4_9ZZZZ